MKRKVFPYCLERSTNVKKDQLSKIQCQNLVSLVFDYKKAAEDQAYFEDKCIKALEYLYGINHDPEVLKIKRKVAGHKHISNFYSLQDDECCVLIEEYNAQINKRKSILASYRNMYLECLNSNRNSMREFVAESGGVLCTLPLINIDFVCKLKKYMTTPVEQHNAKIRKLDHQLIRLFTRATMKTSPFSFLTSVCLYDIEEGSNETDGEVRSICEINNYIIKAVYDFIIEKEHFAKQIIYRLNAFKEYDDSYLFLYQKDYEKGKVYKTVDCTVRLKKNAALKLVVERFAGREFHFLDLVDLFVENGVNRDKASEMAYNTFVRGRIITANVCIDETKQSVFNEFYLKTSNLKDDETCCLQHITQRIREYERLISQFSAADWQMRFEIVDQLDNLLKETEDILGQQFVHNILLYEDTIYTKPRNPVLVEEFNGYEWDELQLFFVIFDQAALTYIVFSEMFLNKYGNKKISADDLDVYKLYAEAATSLTEVWKDNFSEVSFETEDRVRRISELKKQFLSTVSSRKHMKQPQCLKEWINEVVNNNRELFEPVIDSVTLFFQKSDSGDLVINKVYKGQLLFFTRFLKLFNVDAEKISDYCKIAFGSNPLEITESFGFNANTHERLFDKRLVVDMTDQNDIVEGDILARDCYFYYDHQKKQVKLGNDTLGEVNGVYLGSLAQNLMPIPLRTINGMQPSTRFDTSFLNLWDNTITDRLIADHLPRLTYGKIVILREQYLINSIYDLTKSADELYMNVLNDFSLAGLPMRFFIRPYINGSDFDFYNMGRTTLKPQYIDLASPLLFQELLREMENQKQIIIEEVYPDNKKDEYVYEYQMERTLYNTMS